MSSIVVSLRYSEPLSIKLIDVILACVVWADGRSKHAYLYSLYWLRGSKATWSYLAFRVVSFV